MLEEPLQAVQWRELITKYYRTIIQRREKSFRKAEVFWRGLAECLVQALRQIGKVGGKELYLKSDFSKELQPQVTDNLRQTNLRYKRWAVKLLGAPTVSV